MGWPIGPWSSGRATSARRRRPRRERAELQEWERRIQAFLTDRLRLELNQRRRLRPVSDGVDFLGFIVRADYLLVRRRVVSALRERLRRAEAELVRLGLSMPSLGRGVFPWPWPLLEALRQSLNSSLSHLAHASTHRLRLGLRRRFPWLDEYFVWDGDKVVPRCAVPREASRLFEQRAWFVECLPDHVLLIQEGGFWEVVAHPPAARDASAPNGRAGADRWPRRLPRRRLAVFTSTLWESGLPVAWIEETGRRLTDIAERALVRRWSRPASASCRALGGLRPARS